MLHYVLEDKNSSLMTMLIQTILRVISTRENLLRVYVHTYKRSYKLGFKTLKFGGIIYNKTRVHGNYTGL